MGEKKRRLIEEIVRGRSRPHLMIWFNMTNDQIDRFINQNSKSITFEKLRYTANDQR